MKLTIHSVPSQGKEIYFGLLDATTAPKTVSTPHFIMIMDRSGSMGSAVEKIYSLTIPAILERWQYDKTMTLITFDSRTEVMTLDIEKIRSGPAICARGCTNLAPALDSLAQVVTSHSDVRILTLSDGEVHDLDTVLSKSAALRSSITEGRQIQSQAVRYFPSARSNPDTRAVCSLLQYNTAPDQPQLMEVQAERTSAFFTQMGARIADSFGPTSICELAGPEGLIKTAAWRKDTTTSVKLQPGQHLVWFSRLPTAGELSIGGQAVPLEMSPVPLTMPVYHRVMSMQAESIEFQMRMLQVVGTSDSQEDIRQMADFFSGLEAQIPPEMVEGESLVALADRALYLRRKTRSQVVTLGVRLRGLMGDERVAQLNSAQSADYLRQTGSSAGPSRTARALARRAEAHGMDFDQQARDAVRAMHASLDQLVEEDGAPTSFLSLASTYDGIKELCQLSQTPEFEQMGAQEIILMLNLVGIAVRAPIGDYPDPMTYRAHELLLGTYVSLSDVLASKTMGTDLLAPGTHTVIDNVIPLMGTSTARFLKQHARVLLEQTASIGMRRMITAVPKTYAATVGAGLRLAAGDVVASRTEANVRALEDILEGFRAVMPWSYEMLEHVKAAKHPGQLLYLGEQPPTLAEGQRLLLEAAKAGADTKRLLRALWAQESMLMVRRRLRSQACSAGETVTPIYRKNFVHTLLGIDLARYGHELPDAYVEDPEATPYHDVYEINTDVIQPFVDDICRLSSTALLPDVLHLADSSSPLEDYQALPPLTEELVRDRLGIDHSLTDYARFLVIQGVRAYSRQLRVDDEAACMRIPDVGMPGPEAELKMLTAGIYEADYASRRAAQLAKARVSLERKLVDKMLDAVTIKKFLKLFVKGYTRGALTARIVSASDAPALKLTAALLSGGDRETPRPKSGKKLFVMVTGCWLDEDHQLYPVYNGGNSQRIPVSKVVDLIPPSLHTLLKERLGAQHQYRELPNRHGHSNEKPSFWALGYLTITQYLDAVDLETARQYIAEHSHCCGINHLMAAGLLAKYK
eukprot:gnl/Dysnectes_brevis/1443_a1634_1915.p1 GENE.gnl/Dysnectes_brevis/1443_a1634_1915~~gnl/Dysnectes_brevis/1443_a1634_1915.p1  ORF type:complete len:1033 (-),score=454.95 gnl/Dysnectes_brevis/1443_a1634_1915:66-3164(-)